MGWRVAILICRVAAVLSGAVLLGVVANSGRVTDPFTNTQDVCIFNRVTLVCSYSEAVGAMSLVLGVLLLIMDILLLLDMFSDSVVIVDGVSIAVATLMGLMSLVSFGVLISEWNSNSTHEQYIFKDLTDSTMAAQSAMAFSMIALLAWLAILVLSGLDIRSSDSASTK